MRDFSESMICVSARHMHTVKELLHGADDYDILHLSLLAHRAVLIAIGAVLNKTGLDVRRVVTVSDLCIELNKRGLYAEVISGLGLEMQTWWGKFDDIGFNAYFGNAERGLDEVMALLPTACTIIGNCARMLNVTVELPVFPKVQSPSSSVSGTSAQPVQKQPFDLELMPEVSEKNLVRLVQSFVSTRKIMNTADYPMLRSLQSVLHGYLCIMYYGAHEDRLADLYINGDKKWIPASLKSDVVAICDDVDATVSTMNEQGATAKSEVTHFIPGLSLACQIAMIYAGQMKPDETLTHEQAIKRFIVWKNTVALQGRPTITFNSDGTHTGGVNRMNLFDRRRDK